VSNGTYVVVLAFGAALLAVWTHARLPGLAPERLGRTLAHLVASSVLLLLTPRVGQAFDPWIAIFLLVLPALVYAFLSALWMLEHARTALGMQR
jgi:hypothetical protein